MNVRLITRNNLSQAALHQKKFLETTLNQSDQIHKLPEGKKPIIKLSNYQITRVGIRLLSNRPIIQLSYYQGGKEPFSGCVHSSH